PGGERPPALDRVRGVEVPIPDVVDDVAGARGKTEHHEADERAAARDGVDELPREDQGCEADRALRPLARPGDGHPLSNAPGGGFPWLRFHGPPSGDPPQDAEESLPRRPAVRGLRAVLRQAAALGREPVVGPGEARDVAPARPPPEALLRHREV